MVLPPLPRRADTVSSLPLRDPTADKQRSNLGLYILGGFALLGVFVLGERLTELHLVWRVRAGGVRGAGIGT